MITGAPLPSWRILAGLAEHAPDLPRLAAPWLRPGDQGVWYSRSSWALAGLAAAWTRRHGRPPVLWLPAYFCNGTLDPLRRTTQTKLRFVPMAQDMTVAWDSPIDEKPDLILAPHFFGIAQDLGPARDLCRRTGAELIEDCAHVLRPGPGLGDMGDYVMWSPHKLLAVPQGGLLVVRPGAVLSVAELSATGVSPSIGPWLLKRLIQKIVPAFLLPPATRNGPRDFLDDPQAGPMPDTPIFNPWAARLLAGASRDLEKVALERRAVTALLHDHLSALPHWREVSASDDRVPYRLVMRCEDTAVAQERFSVYRCAGLVVESWPDMPPEVMNDPKAYGAALDLRRTILCFAVHQGQYRKELMATLKNIRNRVPR